MDLTKFYENGLVLDKELHFGSGKDISDAINQMNDDGLAVSFIDTWKLSCVWSKQVQQQDLIKVMKSLGWYMFITRIKVIQLLFMVTAYVRTKEMVKHRCQ